MEKHVCYVEKVMDDMYEKTSQKRMEDGKKHIDNIDKIRERSKQETAKKLQFLKDLNEDLYGKKEKKTGQKESIPEQQINISIYSCNQKVVKTGRIHRDIWENFILPFLQPGIEMIKLEKTNRFMYATLQVRWGNLSNDEKLKAYNFEKSIYYREHEIQLVKTQISTPKQFKQIYGQACAESVASSKLIDIGKLFCQKGNHVFRRLKNKRTKQDRCQICNIESTDSRIKQTCGTLESKMCGAHKDMLCTYPTNGKSVDPHKCLCKLCPKINQPQMIDKLKYFMSIRTIIDITKCNFLSKPEKITFKPINF